ncbi:unnamed protein product [Nesidiocoris tenuis]|uniref:Uncharacterized protein n=1 Tax=Nesidiocoris tenuis TaxID=355587 RepID=A0A6H5H5S3_9HEMI|nr:unnamed protein product [Nesidiocoris tenuis]
MWPKVMHPMQLCPNVMHPMQLWPNMMHSLHTGNSELPELSDMAGRVRCPPASAYRYVTLEGGRARPGQLLEMQDLEQRAGSP